MTSRLAKDFRSFADLAAVYTRGRDYRIVAASRRESSTVIVAPHGGGIEAFTGDIARSIAGQEYSLYVFEGLLKAGNFAALHLSSERFDEPECLAILRDCDRVITVHGCSSEGEVVLMGGLDQGLRGVVAQHVQAAGVDCEDAPARLAALNPRNVCNLGRTGEGVQLEVSLALRQSPRRRVLVDAVRAALQR